LVYHLTTRNKLHLISGEFKSNPYIGGVFFFLVFPVPLIFRRWFHISWFKVVSIFHTTKHIIILLLCLRLPSATINVTVIITTTTTITILGWVSPGVATDGMTPIFSLTFFSRHHVPVLGVSPLFFLLKTDDLFCSSLSLLLISLRCHPLKGHSAPFLPVPPRLSTIFCKFAHKIIFSF